MKYALIVLLLAGCADNPQLAAQQADSALRHIERMYPPQPIYRAAPQQNTIVDCRVVTPDWVRCQ